MSLAILQNSTKTSPDYLPTWQSSTEGSETDPFVSEEHAQIEAKVEGIHGKLHPVDEKKLYELAFQAAGDILEIGCLHGRSTTILSLGLRASGREHSLHSVDISEENIGLAKANVLGVVPGAKLRFHLGKSAKVVPTLRHRFAVAFIDGNHRYAPVKADLLAVDPKLVPGGFLFLHDYYDSRNQLPPDDPRLKAVIVLCGALWGRSGRCGIKEDAREDGRWLDAIIVCQIG